MDGFGPFEWLVMLMIFVCTGRRFFSSRWDKYRNGGNGQEGKRDREDK